ncbi:MAG: PqqD family protein [Bacteroidales bacterium]|nr:PqqD family protein [Bacteroidales bacterium]
MELKSGFTLRDFLGEKIVLAEGIENINFNKMLSLNDSAAYLWEKFYGTKFELADVAAALVEKYGISQELADKDAAALVGSWKDAGVMAE